MSTFLVGLIFSFIGSIPPGTINLSVIQLGLKGKIMAALRLGLAAAAVEFGYAYIAIEFQFYITSSQLVQNNFTIISAAVLILLGIVNLLPRKNPSKMEIKLGNSGFRKGILLALANPLAIPFWIVVTAYLQANQWVFLNRSNILIYIAGISAGTLLLLSLLALLSGKAAPLIKNQSMIKKVPGIVLLSLGIYSLSEFLINYFSR